MESAADTLPLQVNSDAEYPEETRLRYRYLDLRRERLHRNILLRSQVIASIRRRMIAARLHRVPDADPDLQLAGGCPRLSGAEPRPSREVLRPAPGPPAVQAAPDGGGLRPLLPDRPVLSRRGRPGRPVAGRVLPARLRDVVRDPGGRLRGHRAGAPRAVRGVPARTCTHHAAAVSAHPLRRGPGPVRHATSRTCAIPWSSAMSPMSSATPGSRRSRGPSPSGAPSCAACGPPRPAQPRSFFDKLNQWAREQGAAGLGYVVLAEGAARGPLAKFLDEPRLAELRARTGAGDGDAVFFVCDQRAAADALRGTRAQSARRGARAGRARRVPLLLGDGLSHVRAERGDGADRVQPQSVLHAPGGPGGPGDQDPLTIKAYQYDIVCNGVELSSGAIRNHRPDIMYKAFAIAGYSRRRSRRASGGC